MWWGGGTSTSVPLFLGRWRCHLHFFGFSYHQRHHVQEQQRLFLRKWMKVLVPHQSSISCVMSVDGLHFLRCHMHLFSIDHHSLNSAWIAMKLGATVRGKCQLSKALLFMPIQALSNKRIISNFCCMSGGGNFNLQGGAIYAGSGVKVDIHTSTFELNTASSVSAVFEAF